MWDFLNDAPTSENATFDPVTGVPTDFRKDTRQTLFAAFVQDDYRARPNLTLTFGLRWEYFGSISEKNDNLSAVVLGAGDAALTGLSLKLGGTLYKPQKTNFGPQLGFAWTPGRLATRWWYEADSASGTTAWIRRSPSTGETTRRSSQRPAICRAVRSSTG
jgi:outer membrane receptor protein involved in Fe transport